MADSSDVPPPALASLGLSRLEVLMATPLDAKVFGFSATGKEALDWWHRLRRSHGSTGYWPVLMDQEAPAYLTATFEYADPATSIASAEALDGAGILAQRGEERLQIYGTDLAGVTRAELRGEGAWPEAVRRPGFRVPFGSSGEALPVTVALIPAGDGWQVPAVLHYGGWNEYPTPAEHAAILRSWGTRYGVELVALTGTTAEFAVRRPPLARLDALALAWEYFVYNDGAYDLYGAETLTSLAAALIGAPVWLAWWD